MTFMDGLNTKPCFPLRNDRSGKHLERTKRTIIYQPNEKTWKKKEKKKVNPYKYGISSVNRHSCVNGRYCRFLNATVNHTKKTNMQSSQGTWLCSITERWYKMKIKSILVLENQHFFFFFFFLFEDKENKFLNICYSDNPSFH